MPIIGKLFNEFNLTKVMNDIEVVQDFQQFVSGHSSDFGFVDELLNSIEMGITELGSDASFLGANVGFAMGGSERVMLTITKDVTLFTDNFDDVYDTIDNLQSLKVPTIDLRDLIVW
ncbi:hypothetical protein [Enterococcus sp. AZ126]|uniref:hypothetical protein n=1 Tax=Enterococcus sp. AZ126 TaxID=2774635 RepID=UPI003F26A192